MKFESDHYVHLKYINNFKHGNKRFGAIIMAHYNQLYAVYPLLYHYLISVFFYDTAINKPHRINNLIQVISYLSFNAFVYWFTGTTNLLDYLTYNLVFSLFPFSYAFWNAKNTGLSARGFGLLTGQLFTYGLLVYMNSGSVFAYVCLIIFALISLLGSQFSFQYVVFVSITTALITTKVELIIPLFVSLVLFRVAFPELFKHYIRGQFNHKKNYALYLASIFIIKYRPNIYRDFVYDFWVRLAKIKTERTQALNYIYTNPIVELIYGFPFLWVTFFFVYRENQLLFSNELFIIIGATLLIFFVISLNPFRFLGEPQRYLEFTLPLITVAFLRYSPSHSQWILIFASAFFIGVTNFIFKQFRKAKANHQELIQFLQNDYNEKTVIASNDTNFIKFLSPYFNIITTDLTAPYANKSEFNFYHKNDYNIQSVSGLIKYHTTHKINLIAINNNFYTEEEKRELNKAIDLSKVKSVANYTIYEIKHV